MFLQKKPIKKFLTIIYQKTFQERKSYNIENSCYTERNFIDKFKVKVYGGSGGTGAYSFYRDRIVKTGAPEGGDGGKGGSVIFKASSILQDLHNIRRPEIRGNKGKGGMRMGKDGKNGKDITVSVPIGTIVYEIGQTQRKIMDLDTDGKALVVAKGGEAGKGNKKHRGIMEFDKRREGKLGEYKEILLELKCLADIGLVGLPNVGKSTILASISRALPKIANYPFTTLSPMIGTYIFILKIQRKDLPGIIQKASENKGLGFEFLKHIERTKILCFVLDVTNEIGLETQYMSVKSELYKYSKEFQNKSSLIVINKCDADIEAEEKFKEFYKKIKETENLECLLVSAKLGYEMGKVVCEMRKLFEKVNNVLLS